MFISVLLHEFGHCFAARWVDGDATEIMMWPLGGLANVDLPHRAAPHFITAAAGPAVNLLFGVSVFSCSLSRSIRHFSRRGTRCGILSARVSHCAIKLLTWNGQEQHILTMWPILLARFFYVNWVLFLLNMVLVCFPMDAAACCKAFSGPAWATGNRR